MSSLNYNHFEESLMDLINIEAEKFSIKLENTSVNYRLKELIFKLYDLSGKGVVILIDEYDKAIIDNIKDISLGEHFRNELNGFYGALKHDEYIEFIFITGVTKTSVFSGLNNVSDLTLDCPLICGYTQEEVETYFGDRLSKFADEENVSLDYILDLIKKWYYGYSYNGEDFFYNPNSILSLLFSKNFKNYWFESGTPSFLIELLSDENIDLSMTMNNNQTISDDIPDFDINNLDLITVLLQTGYLTIKEKSEVLGKPPKYTLGIPNREVHDSLYKPILNYVKYRKNHKLKNFINKLY